MSETVWYKGKLTEIKPTQTRTTEFTARKILVEDRGLEKATYHETYLEALCDELYEEYYTYKGKLYKLTKESYEYDDDIIRASNNVDGTIEYELKYYNGGAGFGECMDEALDKLNA